MIYLNIFLFFLGFIIIWLGATLIVNATRKISHKLKVSPFLFSFLVLGILTSTPEIFISLNSIIKNEPGIMIGNLLGGTLVIFTLLIPILAILGRGISLKHELTPNQMLMTLGVIVAPVFFLLDKQINLIESLILIGVYIFLVIMLERSSKNNNFSEVIEHPGNVTHSILIILLGVLMVVGASYLLIDKTIYFSKLLNIPPFVISILIISLGTNLPELVIAIKAILSKQRDVVFGDYLGSATANTLILGVFSFLSQKTIFAPIKLEREFFVIILGSILLFVFSKEENKISMRDGFILLALYIIFVASYFFYL